MLMREPRGARGPIEWPNIASVLAVDEQTVAFGDYNRETASHRATLAPVDNCADVDKMCLPPGRIGAVLTPWAVVRSALPTHLSRRSGSTPNSARTGSHVRHAIKATRCRHGPREGRCQAGASDEMIQVCMIVSMAARPLPGGEEGWTVREPLLEGIRAKISVAKLCRRGGAGR